MLFNFFSTKGHGSPFYRSTIEEKNDSFVFTNEEIRLLTDTRSTALWQVKIFSAETFSCFANKKSLFLEDALEQPEILNLCYKILSFFKARNFLTEDLFSALQTFYAPNPKKVPNHFLGLDLKKTVEEIDSKILKSNELLPGKIKTTAYILFFLFFICRSYGEKPPAIIDVLFISDNHYNACCKAFYQFLLKMRLGPLDFRGEKSSEIKYYGANFADFSTAWEQNKNFISSLIKIASFFYTPHQSQNVIFRINQTGIEKIGSLFLNGLLHLNEGIRSIKRDIKVQITTAHLNSIFNSIFNFIYYKQTVSILADWQDKLIHFRTFFHEYLSETYNKNTLLQSSFEIFLFQIVLFHFEVINSTEECFFAIKNLYKEENCRLNIENINYLEQNDFTNNLWVKRNFISQEGKSSPTLLSSATTYRIPFWFWPANLYFVVTGFPLGRGIRKEGGIHKIAHNIRLSFMTPADQTEHPLYNPSEDTTQKIIEDLSRSPSLSSLKETGLHLIEEIHASSKKVSSKVENDDKQTSFFSSSRTIRRVSTSSLNTSFFPPDWPAHTPVWPKQTGAE